MGAQRLAGLLIDPMARDDFPEGMTTWDLDVRDFKLVCPAVVCDLSGVTHGFQIDRARGETARAGPGERSVTRRHWSWRYRSRTRSRVTGSLVRSLSGC